MCSRDDDTLPLPGFSEVLSIDETVDEDFIPTSQPQSSGNSKFTKNSDLSLDKLTEESKSPNLRIEDTLPPEAIVDQSTIDTNKSTDFIPDTETKVRNVTYANEEISCKKRLSISGPNDLMGALSNSLWDADVSKIAESPALETQNFYSFNQSLVKSLPRNHEIVESVKMCEDSIIVNDSSETVDLETTPLKSATYKCGIAVENFSVSGGSSSLGDKCEETQIFDNSVLLLDQPEPSSLLKNEKLSGISSEKLHEVTIENDEETPQKLSGSCLKPVPPDGVEPSELNIKEEVPEVPKKNESISSEQKAQSNVAVELESGTGSTLTRKFDINLSATCLISFSPKTKKVLQKIILNVKEAPRLLPKFKAKSPHFDHISDSTSEKSKRHSTSSSGSVYSDKTGLPFPLPVRMSAISDQTDSSEDDIALLRERERKALSRVIWSNEYLLALKMDEILQASLENNDLLNRPNVISPTKSLKRLRQGGNECSEEVSETSPSERISVCSQGSGESHVTSESHESLTKKKYESLEKVKKEVMIAPPNENERLENQITAANENKEPEREQELGLREDSSRSEEENKPVTLCDGLPVFARWTDKRYYSGVLSGDVKSERWEIKFDDGTLKTVREEFIMPCQWLKMGALVFALNDEQYVSGQIVDIKRGHGKKEVQYIVELDTEKKRISARLSDLCLTDVMAGIIREKYKPLSETPRGKADIDFDNVVSGKRIREQKTPLRPPTTSHSKSSGAKRKSSSKNKTGVSEAIKETSQNATSKTQGAGLKSENGHLVEDKIASTDSPSGNEEGKTPLRGASRELRKKAKPRSLSYETEEARSRDISNNWMSREGSPIPGPSGVKFKKRQTKNVDTPVSAKKSSTKSSALNKEPYSEKKSKRKRKLEESTDEVQKKAKGEGKSRSKKG